MPADPNAVKIQGPDVQATPAPGGNPVPVTSDTWKVLETYFGEILLELRRIRLGISLLIDQDLSQETEEAGKE